MNDYVRKDQVLETEIFNSFDEYKNVSFINCTIASLHFEGTENISRVQLVNCTIQEVVLSGSKLTAFQLSNCKVASLHVEADSVKVVADDKGEPRTSYLIDHFSVFKQSTVGKLSIELIGIRTVTIKSSTVDLFTCMQSYLGEVVLSEATLKSVATSQDITFDEAFRANKCTIDYLSLSAFVLPRFVCRKTTFNNDMEIDVEQMKSVTFLQSTGGRLVLTGHIYKSVKLTDTRLAYLEAGMESVEKFVVEASAKWNFRKVLINRINFEHFPRNKDAELRLFNIKRSFCKCRDLKPVESWT
ncbi:MAG: hypothetical protein JNJ75_14835 [Cyclobacteriaceae bacterium]|nr:hypothetical protein [Cyclobacteriaceae bacterium]